MNTFLRYVNNIIMIQSYSHLRNVSIGEIVLKKDVNYLVFHGIKDALQN